MIVVKTLMTITNHKLHHLCDNQPHTQLRSPKKHRSHPYQYYMYPSEQLNGPTCLNMDALTLHQFHCP